MGEGTTQSTARQGQRMGKLVLVSLKEYVLSLGHWGWVVAIDVVYSVTGFVLDVSDAVSIPTEAWLIPLIVALVVAPFIAFHKLRLKRDALQDTLDVRRRRKEIADKLASLYLGGSRAKKTLADSTFSGDAVKLHGDWSAPLIEYFRANSDELGESRLLSLVPDNRDLILFGVADSQGETTMPSYVHSLWTLQLENLRKLIEEFLG